MPDFQRTDAVAKSRMLLVIAGTAAREQATPAAEMAAYLMQRYDIGRQELIEAQAEAVARLDREPPAAAPIEETELLRHASGAHGAGELALASVVAQHFRCLAYASEYEGYAVRVVGHATDLTRVQRAFRETSGLACGLEGRSQAAAPCDPGAFAHAFGQALRGAGQRESRRAAATAFAEGGEDALLAHQAAVAERDLRRERVLEWAWGHVDLREPEPGSSVRERERLPYPNRSR